MTSASPTVNAPTALIAEDEPLLAAALQAELAKAWPELQIARQVGDGLSAVSAALELQPDVVFFDIRMPGQTGLDAAAEMADEWPQEEDAPPLPAIVFVTAYDEYAMAAFEAQATDYLLKPVQADRLAQTVKRLQERLSARQQAAQSPALDEAALGQLRALLGQGIGQSASPAAAPPARLQVIQASHGQQIHMVPVDEVLVFEAADKYVRVLTEEKEWLIRTPLKELLPQLDPDTFWQIHRGTVVRCTAIETVERDEAGKLRLRLRQRKEAWPVSRLHASRFKAM
ncbi:LytTR family DNA-binding domain-containing protein [Hydrogenophaga sp. 5NK40-0174]|uniref:LytR/AlgR family response regulator transcription factor n=1 Tax=Hydrogenophaga sp. 5NK40-0174 TaxID=3127649 RepID=UPI00310BC8A2